MLPASHDLPLTDADHALMASATQEALDRLGVTDDETRRAVGIAVIEAFGTGERDLDRLAETARRRVGV